MNKTILFDLDGTLIDSTCAILESFEMALKGTFAHFDGEQIKAMIGFPLEVMFARLGFKGVEIELCIDKYREHYAKIYLAQSSLLPKAEQALNLVSEFGVLAVVITKSSAFNLVPAFFLFRLFDIVKPFVIGRVDKNVKGGLGVMGDDMLVGLFAGLLGAVIYGLGLKFGLLGWDIGLKELNLDSILNSVRSINPF